MAPAQESPMTQSPSAQRKRRRQMPVIVPAIPRSLEKKPKQEVNPPSIQETHAAASVDDGSQGTQEENTRLLVDITLGDQDTRVTDGVRKPSGSDGATKSKSSFPGALSVSLKVTDLLDEDTSSSAPQEPRSAANSASSPRNLPSPVISPSSSSDDDNLESAGGSIQSPLQEPAEVEEVTTSQQTPKSNHHTLRPTASIFHSQSSSPDRALAPSAASTQQEAETPAFDSVSAQPTYSTGATSPTKPLYLSHGHPHNISFYPPPPPSTEDPSSPSRSLYQGYAYNPEPRPTGYVSHAHSTSHYSQPYNSQVEAYASPRGHYAQYPPYYYGMPTFPTYGTQAPLTPSATPLDSIPDPWRMTNGTAHSGSQQGTYPGSQPRHRSDSHSTLRSDKMLSRDAVMTNGHSRPLQTPGKPEAWSSAKMDVEYGNAYEISSGEAPLAEHLLRHFNNPDCADCELIVSHENDRFHRTKWFLSSILLIRSPILQQLVSRSEPSEAAGMRVLELHLMDRFVTPTALSSALQVLYGKPVKSYPITNAAELDLSASEFSAATMNSSLAYAASGYILGLQNVISRGLEIASDILSWDNLEMALSFGLESEKGRQWDKFSPTAQACYSSELSRDSNGSSSIVVFTPSSDSDQTSPNSKQTSASTSSSKSLQPSTPHSADDLLLHCLDYIIHNFPTSWELDQSARPLADVDRLPITVESRSPLARSRLSHIQFGDHPSELVAKSNDRNVLLSTILFSIPFAKLEYLLSNLGESLARNMKTIIKERERRRRIVLQSKSVSWEERFAAKDKSWSEVGYEESVDTSENEIIKLLRKHTGIARNPAEEHPMK
ncbi:hypothetical protein ACLMJK_004606 [Lecanora helva]